MLNFFFSYFNYTIMCRFVPWVVISEIFPTNVKGNVRIKKLSIMGHDGEFGIWEYKFTLYI